jgi:hypothetical protein
VAERAEVHKARNAQLLAAACPIQLLVQGGNGRLDLGDDDVQVFGLTLVSHKTLSFQTLVAGRVTLLKLVGDAPGTVLPEGSLYGKGELW